MVIEQVTIANEMIEQNDALYIQLVSENIDISTVSHEQLKADSEKVKAIIRTGEAKPFANAILKSGVLF